MRKCFAFFLTLIVAITMLTGCGNSTPDALSDPDIHYYYAGEGPTEGGIKSDEEISNITQEAENGTESTNNNYVSNEGHEPDTYISADNFWQGDDYFDIENYLYMNGAIYVKKGGMKANGSGFEERTDNVDMYKAQFSNPKWIVYVSTSFIWFEYVGYKVDGKVVVFPSYRVFPEYNYSEQDLVTVNEYGSQITKKTIQVLDYMIELTKLYPNDDDPFQYNEHTDVFTATKDSDNYPEGITH